MKTVLKGLVIVLVALPILGAFVYLYKKSQAKPIEWQTEVAEKTDIVKKTVATGVEKKVAAKLLDPCDHCSGSGAEPGSKPQQTPFRLTPIRDMKFAAGAQHSIYLPQRPLLVFMR